MEVNFTEYTFSSGRVHPCPHRLEAISSFPVPKDIMLLPSFLGLCNQLAIFIPNLAALAAPLHGLLKKNVAFCWLLEHILAFEKMKVNLIRKVSIHHFDHSLHNKLIMDASKLHGVGFILIQMSSWDSFVPLKVLQCGLHWIGMHWHSMVPKKCDYFLPGLESFKHHHWSSASRRGFCKGFVSIGESSPCPDNQKKSLYSFSVERTSSKSNMIVDALSRNPIGVSSAAVPIALVSLGMLTLSTKWSCLPFIPCHCCSLQAWFAPICPSSWPSFLPPSFCLALPFTCGLRPSMHWG